VDSYELQLAGRVNWRNHTRLGYQRLTHGVYGRLPRHNGSDEWEVRRTQFLAHTQAVLTAYADRQVALFGTTALQVLGVALPEALQDWANCHLLVPTGSYRPHRRLVVAHRTTGPLRIWTAVNGLPLLHPVDHWLQLRGSDDQMVEVADGLVRRQRPLISLDDFRRRLGELGGVAGVQAGRRLFAQVVPGTDSLYETRTRLVLIRAGLPVPAVNYRVGCRSGFTYYLDLAYVREKVAVEYDGAVHVANRVQMEADAIRRRDLQSEGWLVITVTARQLGQPAQLLRSIEEALILRRAARS